jgi:hypothetical protein
MEPILVVILVIALVGISLLVKSRNVPMPGNPFGMTDKQWAHFDDDWME